VSPLYVAIDLETTGLDTLRDTIIEIGAVRFDDRRELGRFKSLVNPGRRIPLQVSQLTGITDRDVVDAPPFVALREKLARFVGRAVVVGHNVGFDLGFLQKQNCLTQNAYIDTFALATILMPHESRYSLGKLMDSLGISFDTRHRALDDAVATMHLFRALQERALGLSAKTLQHINQAARDSRWPLRDVFRDAERRQARGTFEGSIGAQLRAKGLVDDMPLFAPQRSAELLIPVDQRTALDVDELAAMLEDGGTLATALPNFEYRPQQVEMLRAVASAFNHSRHLLVEAGTGVGKSIAYLLPAIYWAVQNGERVVVSTNTINLQDQLYDKDIPDLRESLPLNLRSTVLKGRSNYLCMRRLQSFRGWQTHSDEELTVLAKVLVWLPNTVTGDRAELFLYGARAREVWFHVSSNADTCTADRCVHRRRGTCFFYRARQAAENAHLIVVNHALLLSDVATDNRVLPVYNYLIVDEAHHLENATTYQLGFAITLRQIFGLLVRIGRNEGPSGGFVGSLLGHCRGLVPDETMGDLEDSAALLREDNERLIKGLGSLFEDLQIFVAEQAGSRGQYDYRLRLGRPLRLLPEWEQIEVVWDGVSELMQSLVQELSRLLDILRDLQMYKVPGYDDLLQDGTGLLRQASTINGQMESVLMEPKGGEITWIRARAKTDEVSLCAVPLRVDRLVEQHLLWPKEAAIFTSATLRTGGDFTFVKERLGAIDASELAVGSPFDYESQVLLYLPTDIPEPNQPYHQKVMNQGLLELALATQGRILALFTSYNQLRTVHRAISRPLAEQGITVYAQGLGASRSQLLENFRETSKAVLLGTRSFWEGIDVPGDPLSCLVLAKLPFAVPNDPVFAARSEEMDDPFYQYTVPDAILRFRQGFGRLIRTKTDRGVAVVMDSRLQTKRYGELFLGSLPSCTTVRGPLADLPRSAAMWIDEGVSLMAEDETDASQSPDAGLEELEYVSFDDL
jgi:DNA polymerase-3 subunit epsilon/ATP-dependent DNA helicase DinG